MLITDALVLRQLALYEARARGAIRDCWVARDRQARARREAPGADRALPPTPRRAVDDGAAFPRCVKHD